MVNVTNGAYHDCINQYNDSMAKSINEIESYFKQNELINLHQQAKERSRAQVDINFHFRNN